MPTTRKRKEERREKRESISRRHVAAAADDGDGEMGFPDDENFLLVNQSCILSRQESFFSFPFLFLHSRFDWFVFTELGASRGDCLMMIFPSVVTGGNRPPPLPCHRGRTSTLPSPPWVSSTGRTKKIKQNKGMAFHDEYGQEFSLLCCCCCCWWWFVRGIKTTRCCWPPNK